MCDCEGSKTFSATMLHTHLHLFYIASISCAPLSFYSPLTFSIIDLHLADASRILDLGLVAIKIETHLDHIN